MQRWALPLPAAIGGSIRRSLFLALRNKSQLRERAGGDKAASHLETVTGVSTILRLCKLQFPNKAVQRGFQTRPTTPGTDAAAECHLLASGCRAAALQTGPHDVDRVPGKEALGFHGCQQIKPNQQINCFSSLGTVPPLRP